MTSEPSAFGQDLLARARARGVTSDEVAALLALPVAAIRRLTSPHEVDQHTAASLRTLADRLDLPWPAWLTTEPKRPTPASPQSSPDSARMHAVLAAAFGHGLHLGEIAHILGWTLDRVTAALSTLTSQRRLGGGARLHHDGDIVALELAPGLIDDSTRHRLHQVLHVYGLGPDVRVLHLVFEVIGMYGHGPTWLREDQDLIDDAIDRGLLVWDTDEADGTAVLELHPDVRYSLGITQYRYPSEEPRGPGADNTGERSPTPGTASPAPPSA